MSARNLIFYERHMVTVLRQLNLMMLGMVLLLGCTVRAKSEAVACSMEQMELDPRSVIEPCTDLLLRSQLSPQERGMALFTRGRGFHRSGQVALAVSDYDLALALIPDNDELHMSRSNVFFRLGDRESGLRHLETAFRLNPKNPHIHVAIGLRQMNSGALSEALKTFSHALTLDPGEPYALFFRA